MKINMPENANKIIETLEAAGYEAYIVGGCVRDSILGRNPEDWDITTSAKPLEVKALFKRTIDTGLQHGTVTVMCDKEAYEVTTYRIDGEYTDHRRPDEVIFTASLEEDLKRRDFTINAMAYSNSRGVIDLFGGMEDLENRVIKAVGVARDRFDEDALRILRAVRFSGQLGFNIERSTREAMMFQAPYLKDISAERIHTELTKLLVSKHPEKLIDAYVLGITAYILPEFDRMMERPQNNPYHRYNVGVHSMEAVKAIGPDPVLRWAALLHDVGKPDTHSRDEKGIDHFYNHSVVGVGIAEGILKRLKFDNDSIRDICALVKWHDYAMGTIPRKPAFRRMLNECGKEFFAKILEIKHADMLAQSDYKLEERKQQLQALEDLYKEVLEANDCITIKELKINGGDLKRLGMNPGKEMGEMLKYLLERVFEDPSLNEKEILEKMVAERLNL